MSSRQAAAFFLATMAFLGEHGAVEAQVRIGTPVALGDAPAVQMPYGPYSQGSKATAPDQFGLAPPTRDQVFRVQTEQALKDRLREELPKVKKVDFPEGAAPLREASGTDVQPFPEQVISPIASQVCYRPLYFEDKLTERFGYYVPCFQPLISTGRFYGDFLILPYRFCAAPPWTFECDNR